MFMVENGTSSVCTRMFVFLSLLQEGPVIAQEIMEDVSNCVCWILLVDTNASAVVNPFSCMGMTA